MAYRRGFSQYAEPYPRVPTAGGGHVPQNPRVHRRTAPWRAMARIANTALSARSLGAFWRPATYTFWPRPFTYRWPPA